MNENVKLDKQKYTATIETLSHDGRGITHIDNKVTFIANTLPGETVHCRLTHRRATFYEAELLDIITPSAERLSPPCPHFGICGGCSLQHMSLTTQANMKEQTLMDQLKHFGHVTPLHTLPPLNALSMGYRRKARLGVKYVIKKEKLLIGFREKSSRYLADLGTCPVLHPEIGQQFESLRSLISQLSCYQHIPQVEFAMGDDKAALVFRHMQPLTESDQAQLMAFGKKYQFDIYLQPNPPATVYQLWPPDSTDRLTYSLPDEGITFHFHPLDFTQIHLEMNRLMVKQAMALLELSPEDRVLDLFCGIGNFTLPIAKRAKWVTGIEGSDEMVQRARENAQLNQIDNADFHAANLMTPDCQADWLKRPYDKILLDPPRAGAKEILPQIGQLGAARIVYISCNPATLARDAGELVHQHGYRLIQAGVMNMFPHTAHIEAMAVFERDKL